MTLIACLSLSNPSKAQSYEVERSVISAGYGVGNFTKAIFNILNSESNINFKYKQSGPFFLKYEYGITEKIGLGLNFAYLGANVSYEDPSHQVTPGVNYYQEVKFRTMSFLPRLNVHFGTSEKVDPYFGVGFGYRSSSFSFKDNDPDYDADYTLNNVGSLGLDLTIGARFYFTPSLGAYIEGGVAKGLIQFGLCAKL